jgi:hypothetical protein
MPLLDRVDKTGAVMFWHNDPIGLKVGVVPGLTLTVNNAVVAH